MHYAKCNKILTKWNDLSYKSLTFFNTWQYGVLWIYSQNKPRKNIISLACSLTHFSTVEMLARIKQNNINSFCCLRYVPRDLQLLQTPLQIFKVNLIWVRPMNPFQLKKQNTIVFPMDTKDLNINSTLNVYTKIIPLNNSYCVVLKQGWGLHLIIN